MSILAITLLSLFIGVLDISLNNAINSHFAPHIGLIIFVFFALIYEKKYKYLMAIPLGIMLDIYSNVVLGTHVMIFVIISFLLELAFVKAFDKKSTIGIFTAAAGATICYEGLLFGFMYFEKIFGFEAVPVLNKEAFLAFIFHLILQSLMVYLIVRSYYGIYQFVEKNVLKKAHYS